MSSFRLSQRADSDLLDIFVYGIEQFGEAQAERYQIDMTRCFGLLADNPRMGRPADSIAPGVRRHEHASHVILYEEDADGVLILAVVHGRNVRHLKV